MNTKHIPNAQRYVRSAQFIKYGNSIVAEVFGDNVPVDGDAIVRACNNHEALLAALRDLYTECDAWQHEELDGHPTWGPIMRAARAAIAACEVQS